MAKLTQLHIDIIQAKTHCGISEEENYYTVWVDNSAGEDFSYEIEKGDNEIEEIISRCENFDPEEHFRIWYGANNGEPSDPRALLDNCDQIGERLDELADLLRDFDFETAQKISEDNPKLTNDELCEIIENGSSEVLALWENKDEMAHEELDNFLPSGAYEMVENYFDFERYADDLLDNSNSYLELSSGRVVYVE